MERTGNGKFLKVLSLAIAFWGLLTALDIGQRSEAGFETDSSYRVIRVEPGSAAEAAGLVRGDQVSRINDVDTGDKSGLTSLGRARIDETRELVVRREEELLTLGVRYRALSARSKRLAWLSLLPGFAFLGFCVAAWVKTPVPATRVLAMAGIGCSLVFFKGPAFATPLVASLFSVGRSALVLGGFVAMLHFLLLFPRPGPFVERTRNVRLLYVPAFLFWLLVSYRALFASDTASALNIFTYVLAGLVSAIYLLAGIIVFLRRYIKAPREDRRSFGLNLVLWGSLLGFLPAALGYMPALSGVPGREYFFISLILPPLSWALAASQAFGRSD